MEKKIRRNKKVNKKEVDKENQKMFNKLRKIPKEENVDKKRNDYIYICFEFS